MKAIVMTETPGVATLVNDRQPPTLRPGYLLVDVKAVALNPTDWKHVEFSNTKDCLSGCDVCYLVPVCSPSGSFSGAHQCRPQLHLSYP